MVLQLNNNVNDGVEIDLFWTNETEQGIQVIANFNPTTDLQHDFVLLDAKGAEIASLTLEYDVLEVCGHGLLRNVNITGGESYERYVHEFSKQIHAKWNEWDLLNIGSEEHISKLLLNNAEWFYTNVITPITSIDDVRVVVKHGVPIQLKNESITIQQFYNDLPFGGDAMDYLYARECLMYLHGEDVYKLATNSLNVQEINIAMYEAGLSNISPKQILINNKEIYVKIGTLLNTAE